MKKLYITLSAIATLLITNGCAPINFYTKAGVVQEDIEADLKECRMNFSEYKDVKPCMEEKGYYLGTKEDKTGTMYENLQKRR